MRHMTAAWQSLLLRLEYLQRRELQRASGSYCESAISLLTCDIFLLSLEKVEPNVAADRAAEALPLAMEALESFESFVGVLPLDLSSPGCDLECCCSGGERGSKPSVLPCGVMKISTTKLIAKLCPTIGSAKEARLRESSLI